MPAKWNGDAVAQAVRAKVQRNMHSAMQVLQGEVQLKISVDQPVKRSKGGRLRGTTKAAPPPAPPRVLTGDLRKSIKYDVLLNGSIVTGRIGSNLKYARRLEFGFHGTDSRGRNVNQDERPYLRSALKEQLNRLGQIIARP